MQILFARHGNTFAPGDKVVWVGRETDLPLVEKGLVQAHAAARALRSANAVPDVIFAAGLQRTRRFAEIIAQDLGLAAPLVDPRLDELDYGKWAGRTNDEIAADGPAFVAALDAWGKRDAWPDAMGWVSHWPVIHAAITAFCGDLLSGERHRRPLVVSSNGILRFLPRLLLPNEAHRESFKMGTGHLGVIESIASGASLRCWDVAPADFKG